MGKNAKINEIRVFYNLDVFFRFCKDLDEFYEIHIYNHNKNHSFTHNG